VNGLLFLAPALVLALAMLVRRYPGEGRIVALAARRRPAAPRRSPTWVLAAVATRAPWALVPRGSALLACALATRPPPAALPS
jgi:hypothetical protein